MRLFVGRVVSEQGHSPASFAAGRDQVRGSGQLDEAFSERSPEQAVLTPFLHPAAWNTKATFEAIRSGSHIVDPEITRSLGSSTTKFHACRD